MTYLGIDIGSLSCDAVLIDDGGNILASAVVPTGSRNQEAIRRAKREVLDRAGIEEAAIRGTVSTGYGRERGGWPAGLGHGNHLPCPRHPQLFSGNTRID